MTSIVSGLLPESIYAAMKKYLLSLEGLFRSFLGEVARTDESILKAIQVSVGELDRDMVKAEKQYIDNAIFNLGSVKSRSRTRRPKGKSKGAELLQVSEAGLESSDEDPDMPWYIFQAKNISKVGHSIQAQLLSKSLISYYCEWCSTPKPDVRGCAYKNVAFLYDVEIEDTGEIVAMQQTTDIADRRQIYVGIPHQLCKLSARDPALEACMQRVKQFYAETFNKSVFMCY